MVLCQLVIGGLPSSSRALLQLPRHCRTINARQVWMVVIIIGHQSSESTLSVNNQLIISFMIVSAQNSDGQSSGLTHSSPPLQLTPGQ